MPIATGPETEMNAVPMSRIFLATVRLRAALFITIDSIRFFRLEPVTPDAQGRGVDKQNLQTLRIPSA
jgi:hypothetical protein